MTAIDEVPWSLTGQEFVHCNRAYECIDQLNPEPAAGPCQAVAGFYVEHGRYGATDISGLSIALVATWPGAIEQGGGQALPIVDENADEDQRSALLAIMNEAHLGTTFFAVFPTQFAKVHDPVFAFVGVVVDVTGRRALVKVPGVVDARGEPILDKATGEPRQEKLGLPDGRETATVELGRGWASVNGPIAFEMRDTQALFAHLQLTGVALGQAAP